MTCTAVIGDGDEGVRLSGDKSSDRGVIVDVDVAAVDVAAVGNGSNKSVNGAIPSGGRFSVRIFMNMYPNNNTAKQNTAPETRPRMNEPPVERSLIVVA